MREGTCQHIKEIPQAVRDTFVVSGDISAEEHVLMQGALQAFVEKWPGELSSFGKISITEHLDGREPYLDSHQPIPPEHIERAAAKSEIAAAYLDAQIASLNQHLGWDIRVGDRP